MNQWNKPALGSTIDPQHPLSQGCVMALCMLEGAGNRTYDLTHNGNDGVLTNGPLWKPGRNGAAIEFDGVDDYALVTHGGSLTFRTGDFSVTLWAKPTSMTAYGGLITTDISGDAAWKIFRDSNQQNFQARYGTFILSYPTVSVGDWHQYGYVKSGTTLTIYLDGVEVNSGTCPATHAVDGTELLFGSYRVNDGKAGRYMYDGLLDEVRIYNRALSPDEVQDLYINPYGFIYKPKPYWLMPQGVTIPPHLFRRVA